MVYRTLKSTALLALLLVAACGGKPPPKDPANTDEGTSEATPTPPAPKKCETLEEKCTATAKTIAKVKSAKLVFTPGETWTYAQGENNSVAQMSADGAVLAFASYTPDKDAKKDAAARDAAFAEIVKTISVTPPKGLKVNWKKPDAPQESNGLKLGIWQVQGAERGKKKGILLVVQGPVSDEHALIGAGFAAEDDEAGMGAISKSIESIKPDDKAVDDKKADDKKADDKK